MGLMGVAIIICILNLGINWRDCNSAFFPEKIVSCHKNDGFLEKLKFYF
ncbi:hypothetical protein SeSB_A0221 [Salmonella enterica subsp. enterica serovar Schwarzengrund str. SL480]|uniref:Uncharacterized protein n=1 Tax=Salmonella schwarzengrund (strain CVM19633) TaxID=439843 RepID=A0A0N1QV64_SALSV|nr:hypothetical protein SeSA_A0035 [Salmonella enterica subsp. enterica serovar Schwarzengrund str. CVM19633]EDY31327.1 hypothetical protein SeSB_A0221 [Salmonella enterica subsp. enterica serovar Schwarzengrund str. SL480]